MTFVIQYMSWKPLRREGLKAITAYKFAIVISLLRGWSLFEKTT
jgi:hypothetical protein